MRLDFLWIGETRASRIRQIEEFYLEKVNRFLPASRSSIPDLKKSDARRRMAQFNREAQLIERRLPGRTWLVVLDENGTEFSSPQFAEWLGNLMHRNVSIVTFLVGGHLGIPGPVKESADFQLSLSRLTLPHELIRVVLLEQVYRALSILRGLPYHK